MCGIAGWLDLRHRRMAEPAMLAAMAQAIGHRGPDGDGFYFQPGIGLAHRRLAVIDLASGAQPMQDASERFTISFNGEIYNFPTLRRELESLGHVFRTHSDTEVILESWKQWGDKCLARLEGMFAFALWDSQTRALFLARDRMGEKPLFYAALGDGTLLFASEIAALLTHRGLDRKIDPAAVEEFFALGYIANPRTIYSTIRKLPPASCLRLCAGEPLRLWSYWDVPVRPVSVADAAPAELADRLEKAVAKQMLADVPLGTFLSGGIDSGVVTSLLARQMRQPAQCFTIGFSDPRFDESPHAAMVAQQIGAHHHVQTVQGTEDDLASELAVIFGEPFGDSSAIPALRLMRLARQHVTVALSGDGGDELFAGYRRYPFHLKEEAVRAWLPQWFRAGVFGMLASVYPRLDWLPRPLRARQTLSELSQTTADGYFANFAIGDEPSRRRLYAGQLRRDLQGYSARDVVRRHFAAAPFDDPLAKAQYVDLKSWLPDDILTKVDRTAMACSLEVRVPMLDAELVEFALNLPQAMKLKNGEGKVALRKVAARLLPPSLMSRSKQGFSVPLASWFRGGLGRQFEDDLQGEDLLAEFLDTAMIAQMLSEHRSGLRDHSRPLWCCWMFHRFLRDVHQAPIAHYAREMPRSRDRLQEVRVS